MNLVIKQGDLVAKVAVYEKYKTISSALFTGNKTGDLSSVLNHYALNKGVLATAVGKSVETIYDWVHKLPRFLKKNRSTKLPISVQYIYTGITTRFRVFNNYTQQLPLVKARLGLSLIGYSTESAI